MATEPIIIVHSKSAVIDYWREFDMKAGEMFYIIRRMSDGRYNEYRLPEIAATKLLEAMTEDIYGPKPKKEVLNGA